MVPFVMGTTGGDRERLVRDPRQARVREVAMDAEGAAHSVSKYGALCPQHSTCTPSRTPRPLLQPSRCGEARTLTIRGGGRSTQLADVKAAGLYAVIAPQMGKQVVAFQVRTLFPPTTPALAVIQRIEAANMRAAAWRLAG
jgi:hypothetical protein